MACRVFKLQYLKVASHNTFVRVVFCILLLGLISMPCPILETKFNLLLIIYFLQFANGSSVKKKKRYLLLFNNIILCAAPNRKTQRQEEMEGTTGSK